MYNTTVECYLNLKVTNDINQLLLLILTERLTSYLLLNTSAAETDMLSMHSYTDIHAHNVQGRPKNWGHFVLRPITLEILNRSLPNLAQITV